MDGVKSVETDLANQIAICTVVTGKFEKEKAIAALDVDYGPSSVLAEK
ncbi:MAG: hypothetical protein IIA67_05100 [Planctomycetes bacterium]|nr:hypothetical protein [Planctomycetota bacterium]